MTTPIDEFTPEEFDEFCRRVGYILFWSPAACMFARHSNPLSTIRDYFDVEKDISRVGTAARLFVKEFSRVTSRKETEAFATRWHGPNPAGKAAAKIAAGMPGLGRRKKDT
jgi:hypothetical protein